MAFKVLVKNPFHEITEVEGTASGQDGVDEQAGISRLFDIFATGTGQYTMGRIALFIACM